MRTTETRRIQSSGLTYGDYGSGTAYWGTYTRYRNGSRVYRVPFGIVWWSGPMPESLGRKPVAEG